MENKRKSENRICFMFAGIGEDYRKKMNKLGEEQLAFIAELSNQAEEEFGIRIMECLMSAEDVRYDNLTIWSSIYTCDYAVARFYQESGIKPELYMGYSMGLITALASGGAFDYLDGIRILKAILRYHKGEYPETMATVIGFDEMQIRKMFEEQHLEEVYPACINNEYCIVISGLKESVEKAVELVANQGALKVHPIPTEFAFHTHYFEEGVQILEECVNQIDVRDLEIPLLSSITQEMLTDKEALRSELVRNMISVMNWKNSVETACKNGYQIFYESGLGKGLVKCSRIINAESSFYTFDKLKK